MDFLGVGSLGVLRFTETLTFIFITPRNDNPPETSHLFLATSRDQKEKKFHRNFLHVEYHLEFLFTACSARRVGAAVFANMSIV